MGNAEVEAALSINEDPRDTGHIIRVLQVLGLCGIDLGKGKEFSDDALNLFDQAAKEYHLAATKSYIRFVMEGKPWHEEVTLWRDQESEPSKVAPLILAAYDKASHEGSPKGLCRPIHCASFLVSLSPATLYFHSRDVASPAAGPTREQAIVEAIGYPMRPSHAPLSPVLDYFYIVYCINLAEMKDQELRARWEAEILGMTPAYMKEPKVQNLEVIYQRQDIAELAKYVTRLANLHALGGQPEKPF
jgi:hypothetical protein